MESHTKAAKIERAAADKSNEQVSHEFIQFDLGMVPWPNKKEEDKKNKKNEFPLQPFCPHFFEADVADPEEMAEQQELNARTCGKHRG